MPDRDVLGFQALCSQEVLSLYEDQYFWRGVAYQKIYILVKCFYTSVPELSTCVHRISCLMHKFRIYKDRCVSMIIYMCKNYAK